MKFTKLMLAGLAMGMMTSCSQEEDLTIANSNETQGEAYMSLSIQMPDGRNTRAIDPGIDGDKGTDAGTTDEQFVSNVSIYVWETEKPANAPVVAYYEANQLRPGKPNDPVQETSKVTVYTTPSFAVSKGAHKVVVVVNGGNPETEGSLFNKGKMATPGFMREAMELNPDAIQKLSNAKHFVMTNANPVISQDENGNSITPTTPQTDNFYTDGTVGINVTGNKDNPTTVVVPVERVVAKIEDRTESYLKSVENTQGDQVTFTEVNLLNANTKFFPIKNVRAQHVTNVWPNFILDPHNDYIVDPNFDKKDLNVADFYGKVTDTNSELRKTLNTKNRAHFYTLENTMICQEQKDIYTTGLYYKAIYKLYNHLSEKDVNVYKFKGKLYTFTELLADNDFQPDHYYTENDPSTGKNVQKTYTFTDDSSIEDFAKVGVTKYDKGVCYYPVWIRHVRRDDIHLAPMEFGVVRNNYYQIFLGNVHGIGSNVPVNPDPEKPNPDEIEDAMLDVAVKVLPWTVRENHVDL